MFPTLRFIGCKFPNGACHAVTCDSDARGRIEHLLAAAHNVGLIGGQQHEQCVVRCGAFECPFFEVFDVGGHDGFS